MRFTSALIAVAALFIAGCGGGSTEPVADPTTTEAPATTAPASTTTAAPASTTTTTAPTTTSTTTTTTTTTAPPSNSEICDVSIATSALLFEALLDEIDDAVAGSETPDIESLDSIETAAQLLVDGCPGELLPRGLSELIVLLADDANSEGRSDLARQTAQTFLEVLCGVDRALLDDDAGEACDVGIATEPVAADVPPEVYREVFLGIWDDWLRADLVDALRLSTEIDTVDFVEFDAETDTLVIDVTSRWASSANQVDGAWAITRGLAPFWETDNVFAFPDWPVSLRLVNSGSVYACSADFMTRLADTRASRGDWDRECAN